MQWQTRVLSKHQWPHCVQHVFSMKVTDAIVLMDREQGGVEMLSSQCIRLHPIISMSKLLNVLVAAERIDAQTAQSVHKFIRDNNTFRYSCVALKSIMGFSAYFPCNNSKATLTTCSCFSSKDENGSEVPATKKPCVEQNLELSYADRAKLPST